MSAEALRAYKLKTGVVRRLSEELAWYMKELTSNREKVAELRALDAEQQNFLKQWEDVASETARMIPDGVGRLRKGIEDLEMLLEDSPEEEAATDEHQAAVKAVKVGKETIVLAQGSGAGGT